MLGTCGHGEDALARNLLLLLTLLLCRSFYTKLLPQGSARHISHAELPASLADIRLGV
jgi:hypothetical protein